MPPSDPTRPDDLLAFRLGRRALRRDAGRLARLGDGVLAGTEHLDPRRLETLSSVVERFCDEFVQGIDFEETLLWPALERLAPEALPYAGFREDRRVLRALGDDARRATRAVVRNLADRPAALATPADHRGAAQFAAFWRVLDLRLTDFLDGTDEDVLTLVTTHLPRTEWVAGIAEARRTVPDRRAAGARVVDVATPAELALLTGQLGHRPLAGWRSLGRRRRAEDTLLFGPEADVVADPGTRVQDGG